MIQCSNCCFVFLPSVDSNLPGGPSEEELIRLLGHSYVTASRSTTPSMSPATSAQLLPHLRINQLRPGGSSGTLANQSTEELPLGAEGASGGGHPGGEGAEGSFYNLKITHC